MTSRNTEFANPGNIFKLAIFTGFSHQAEHFLEIYANPGNRVYLYWDKVF